MIAIYIEKALSALGLTRCPKCGKARIEVKVAKRDKSQCDGLEGIVARCRTCGHQWIVNRIVPVV